MRFLVGHTLFIPEVSRITSGVVEFVPQRVTDLDCDGWLVGAGVGRAA
jgi:hypothetical protein